MVWLSSDPSHLELGLCAALADGFELVLPEAAQVVFGEASFAEEGCEDEREDGVAVVVLAVDLLAALCQPALQLPQCGWLMNLRGPVLLSLASRMTASRSRPSARSKARRATAFSAGDHFISRSRAAAWVVW